MNQVKLNHVCALRQNPTEVEKQLWYYLRARRLNNYKFRKQHLIHPYVVDFVCLSKKLIIECDGGQHLEQQAYDAKRQKFLMERGFRVLNFWNNEVLNDLGSVLEVIVEALEGPPIPSPFPPPTTWRKGGHIKAPPKIPWQEKN